MTIISPPPTQAQPPVESPRGIEQPQPPTPPRRGTRSCPPTAEVAAERFNREFAAAGAESEPRAPGGAEAAHSSAHATNLRRDESDAWLARTQMSSPAREQRTSTLGQAAEARRSTGTAEDAWLDDALRTALSREKR